MKLPTQGTSKAEIVFRIQEVIDRIQEYHQYGKLPADRSAVQLNNQYFILDNILRERYGASFIHMPQHERELLITEYGLQLESETNNI